MKLQFSLELTIWSYLFKKIKNEKINLNDKN